MTRFRVTENRIFTVNDGEVSVFNPKLLSAPDWFVQSLTSDGMEHQLSVMGHTLDEKSDMGVDLLTFLSTVGVADPVTRILDKKEAEYLNNETVSSNDKRYYRECPTKGSELLTVNGGNSALRSALLHKRWGFLIDLRRLPCGAQIEVR